MVLIAAVAVGIVCGLPFVLAARKKTVESGLGAVIVSFVVLSASLFAASRMAPEQLVPFGVLSVLTFLAIATAALLLGMRHKP